MILLPEQVGFFQEVSPRLFNPDNFRLSSKVALSAASRTHAEDHVRAVFASHPAFKSSVGVPAGGRRTGSLSIRSYDARGLFAADIPALVETVARQAAAKVRVESSLASAVVLQLSAEEYLIVYVVHHLAGDQHSLRTLDRQLSAPSGIPSDPYEDAVRATWAFLDRPEAQASAGRWWEVRSLFGATSLYESSGENKPLECSRSVTLDITDDSLSKEIATHGDGLTESVGSAIAAFVGSAIVAETVHNGRAVSTERGPLIVQGSARLASSVGMFATTGFRRFGPDRTPSSPEPSLDALVAGLLERKRGLVGESSFAGAWLWLNQVAAPRLAIGHDSLTEVASLPAGPAGLGLERDFADVGAGCALIIKEGSAGVRLELTYSERYLSPSDARSMMEDVRAVLSR